MSGLDNLRSVFLTDFSSQQSIENLKEIYQSNQPADKFNTKFNYNESSLIERTYGFGVSIESPILDSVLRGREYEQLQFSQDFQNNNLFVKPETGEIIEQLFKTQTFDPRADTPKEGTLYFNTGKTFNRATNPTDFSTAVGNNDSSYNPVNLPFSSPTFMDELSWEKLYEDNHTPLSNPSHEGKVPIHYPNVNRDNLKIGKRDHVIGERYGFNRGDEPYVTSRIGDSGRLKNAGSRSIPIIRALVDGGRIINYLTSADGLAFMAKQNINVGIQNTVIRKNGSLLRVPQRYGVVYNPLSTLIAASGRVLGQGIPNVLFRRQGSGGSDAIAETLRGWEQFRPGISTFGVKPETKLENMSSPVGDENRNKLADLLGNRGDNVYGVGKPNGVDFSIHSSLSEAGDNQAGTGNGIFSQIKNAVSTLNPFSEGSEVAKTITGDKMTLAPMIKGPKLTDAGSLTVTDATTGEVLAERTWEFGAGSEVDASAIAGGNPVGDVTHDGQELGINGESIEHGMPFYFKDLRDDTYIYFRAYVEGLTENISPSYSSTNYIGRSEPVWIYERAEREISMTLKLVAQTSTELDSIYLKMDRLTSMCYPQYIGDDYGNRMKPPLTKLRYGELFGSMNKELMGYIKSISYAVDNSATYETELGKRVPRHVMATLAYQVIHDRTPSINTRFYGITNKLLAD